MKAIQILLQAYRSLTASQKRNVAFVSAAYFLVVGTYTSLRSICTALYIQTYGAKETPLVSFISVFVLFGVVAVFNQLQKRRSIQTLFIFNSLLSAAIFLGCFKGTELGFKPCASILFIWKEIYIMFMIHMIWGYVNNLLKESSAKIMFGFIAAMGGIGGTLEGILLGPLTRAFGIQNVMIIGAVQLLIIGLLFGKTDRLNNEKPLLEKPKTPMGSLKGAERYVGYIAALIILSQFCIAIVDFEFNMHLQKSVPDLAQKTSQLGLIFASINGFSFIIKLLILPLLFSFVSNHRIQIAVPATYLVLSVLGLGLGSSLFLSVALSFMLFKSIDYSVFSVSKELLYYPLTPEQKYGTKYLADIFVYRFAKAVISFVLIFVQKPLILNTMLAGFLGLWILLTVRHSLKPAAALKEPAVPSMELH